MATELSMFATNLSRLGQGLDPLGIKDLLNRLEQSQNQIETLREINSELERRLTHPIAAPFVNLAANERLLVSAQIRGQFGGTARAQIWLNTEPKVNILDGTKGNPEESVDFPRKLTDFDNSPHDITALLNRVGMHELKMKVTTTPASGGKNWDAIVSLIHQMSNGERRAMATVVVAHNDGEQQRERTLTTFWVAYKAN
jgi:hypothetical protein